MVVPDGVYAFIDQRISAWEAERSRYADLIASGQAVDARQAEMQSRGRCNGWRFPTRRVAGDRVDKLRGMTLYEGLEVAMQVF